MAALPARDELEKLLRGVGERRGVIMSSEVLRRLVAAVELIGAKRSRPPVEIFMPGVILQELSGDEPGRQIIGRTIALVDRSLVLLRLFKGPVNVAQLPSYFALADQRALLVPKSGAPKLLSAKDAERLRPVTRITTLAADPDQSSRLARKLTDPGIAELHLYLAWIRSIQRDSHHQIGRWLSGLDTLTEQAVFDVATSDTRLSIALPALIDSFRLYAKATNRKAPFVLPSEGPTAVRDVIRFGHGHPVLLGALSKFQMLEVTQEVDANAYTELITDIKRRYGRSPETRELLLGLLQGAAALETVVNIDDFELDDFNPQHFLTFADFETDRQLTATARTLFANHIRGDDLAVVERRILLTIANGGHRATDANRVLHLLHEYGTAVHCEVPFGSPSSPAEPPRIRDLVQTLVQTSLRRSLIPLLGYLRITEPTNPLTLDTFRALSLVIDRTTDARFVVSRMRRLATAFQRFYPIEQFPMIGESQEFITRDELRRLDGTLAAMLYADNIAGGEVVDDHLLVSLARNGDPDTPITSELVRKVALRQIATGPASAAEAANTKLMLTLLPEHHHLRTALQPDSHEPRLIDVILFALTDDKGETHNWRLHDHRPRPVIRFLLSGGRDPEEVVNTKFLSEAFAVSGPLLNEVELDRLQRFVDHNDALPKWTTIVASGRKIIAERAAERDGNGDEPGGLSIPQRTGPDDLNDPTSAAAAIPSPEVAVEAERHRSGEVEAVSERESRQTDARNPPAEPNSRQQDPPRRIAQSPQERSVDSSGSRARGLNGPGEQPLADPKMPMRPAANPSPPEPWTNDDVTTGGQKSTQIETTTASRPTTGNRELVPSPTPSHEHVGAPFKPPAIDDAEQPMSAHKRDRTSQTFSALNHDQGGAEPPRASLGEMGTETPLPMERVPRADLLERRSSGAYPLDRGRTLTQEVRDTR